MERAKLLESIDVISSADSDRSEFGSCFMIKRERNSTYWITCAHVIDDVGGIEKTRLGNYPVHLVGVEESALNDLSKSHDLVVLKTEGKRLLKKKPLSLLFSGNRGLNFSSKKYLNFSTIGHFRQSGTHQTRVREICGQLRLSEDQILGDDGYGSYCYYNVLELNVNATNPLQPGYSGSPVLVQNSNSVVGVVSQSRDNGVRGEAMDVDAIGNILRRIPSLCSIVRNTATKSKIELDKLQAFLSDRSLRLVVTSEVREVLNWLDEREPLINSIIHHVQDKLSNMDGSMRDKSIKILRADLNYLLRMLHFSLLTSEINCLDDVELIPSSLAIDIHVTALECIKEGIPTHVDDKTSAMVKKHINYLTSKLKEG